MLGGSFGEGIDLPGTRCIGAFVATLGLPPVTPLNEHIRRCMHDAFGAGFEYAYLVPGVQKVVQAAGRVLRSADDRGVVHLIDDRWRRPQVRRLLPAWWEVHDAAERGRPHGRLLSSSCEPAGSPRMEGSAPPARSANSPDALTRPGAGRSQVRCR